MKLVAAAALEVAGRDVAASLIGEAFAQYYASLGVSDAHLRAALASELTEAGTELEHTLALVVAGDGPVGVMAAYPSEEVSARQRAGMFHLLSSVDDDEADRIIEATQRHAGSVSAVPDGTYYLARLAVDARHRGSGGAALLMAALRRGAKGRPLSLHVHEDNARAIAFYRREGFEIQPTNGLAYLCMTGE